MTTATVDGIDVAALTELLTVPEPEELRLWHHGWSGPPVSIRGPEHLAVLLTSLRPNRDFAGITAEVTGRWAQVKRVDSGWWVEGGDPGREWPWVFVPEGWTRPRRLDGFACWRHPVAAELVWAWLDGCLAEGVVRLPAPGGRVG